MGRSAGVKVGATSSRGTGCGLLWAGLCSLGHLPRAGVSPTWPASLFSLACLAPEGSPGPPLWMGRNQGADGDRLAKVAARAGANHRPASLYLLLPSRCSGALWCPHRPVVTAMASPERVLSSGGSTWGLQGTRGRGRRAAGGLLPRGPSPSPHCTAPTMPGPPVHKAVRGPPSVWRRPGSRCTSALGEASSLLAASPCHF